MFRLVGGDTESSAILRSSNRAPGPLLTKGTRLGTRARLLVRRNPYEKRKITVPGDAIFFSARALRVFGAVFFAVLAGKEARLFVGEVAVSTNTSLTLASLASAVLPSQMPPAQWRDVWQVRAGGLRLKGSDGDAGAHTIYSGPAREELLNVTAIVASSSTPPSAGCPARQYSHRCRAI